MDLDKELAGPNPRNYGRYDAVAGRFVRSRSFGITMRQWLLYQQTGLYGRPMWVVQGRNGGHKRFWNDVENGNSTICGSTPRFFDQIGEWKRLIKQPELAFRGLFS